MPDRPSIAVLPLVNLSGDSKQEYFGDGAMRQLNPMSPAIHLGAERLLIIGVRAREDAGVAASRAAPTMPTPGQILASMSDDKVGGDSYDREWPERARNSMW